MFKKEDCVIGTKGVVNSKISSWNIQLGSKNNGLICFEFTNDGVVLDSEIELPPNTEIEIQSPPKRISSNGSLIQFKVNDKIMSAWWICFKQKVNKN